MIAASSGEIVGALFATRPSADAMGSGAVSAPSARTSVTAGSAWGLNESSPTLTSARASRGTGPPSAAGIDA